MIGNAPSFCLLVVGSNSGLVGMTKEHFGLVVALSLPVIIGFRPKYSNNMIFQA